MSLEAVGPTSHLSKAFGPVYIVEPKSQHTRTAILLHGRGSSGEEFAEELFESKLSDQTSLAQKFPSWRWVFPSSRTLWSTAFEEEMPAWFEAHSLTDITARQDLQIPGIRESVGYVEAIVTEEIERLGGEGGSVVLGGISQGAALGIWTLLCSSKPDRQLGAFVGASAWLPFAANLETFFGGAVSSDDPTTGSETNEGDAFVEEMMARVRSSLLDLEWSSRSLQIPVFLGHGEDDAYVDVDLGRRAGQLLSQIGLMVEWRQYSGAEQEGHWLKTPEEVDDIASFLMRKAS